MNGDGGPVDDRASHRVGVPSRSEEGDRGKESGAADKENIPRSSVPGIELPKGGGAIRGIGEKFSVNAATGTGTLSIPIVSVGRASFSLALALSYDSGSGNGPFGFGWSLGLPAITRRTDRGLPRYCDGDESDVYLISGAEDLVPVLDTSGARFEDATSVSDITIHRYRPRIEGMFGRIERWTHRPTGDVHWRSISAENITTVYGKDTDSRIEEGARTFSWMVCERYDAIGNAVRFEYVDEDGNNVDLDRPSEQRRDRSTNRYLKRIRGGNRVSRLTDPTLAAPDWMFEVVFDYDEGHIERVPLDPTRPADAQLHYVRASEAPATTWSVRPDTFSTYKAGFEVRTHRRCKRVLVFHRFAELGEEPCLVRSLDLDYDDASQPAAIDDELAFEGSTRFGSYVRAVTDCGYVRDATQDIVERNGARFATYLVKTRPALELDYSRTVLSDVVQQLDDVENLPEGLDARRYQWVDLDGEGISGVATQQGEAWYYKPNRGGGKFGALLPLPMVPSVAHPQFLDLDGDGLPAMVVPGGGAPGFWERNADGGWEPFRAFRDLPTLRWSSPNARLVDLDGDGLADILITEDELLTWFPSHGKAGFGAAMRVRKPRDEERGPRLVFADGTESIYLADMSGDGLTDLVRIRNGQIAYWPNLGYGRFAAMIEMDDPPWFDDQDQFDQRRVHLADIDGSGTTDIIYYGRDGADLYFNHSGNGWSSARHIAIPRSSDLASFLVTDLLGRGTQCLVWSSPLPADERRPVHYIDLLGGIKPHLLVASRNNLGAEKRIFYAASTKFYLADKAAGTPWITRLPFPVQVVERVVTFDQVSRNRFVSRYSYHHGFFDGVEREFRGFGRVDQLDTEELAALASDGQLSANEDAVTHVPPTLTKTWFHTGVNLGRQRISRYFAGLLDDQDLGEYYRPAGATDAEASALLLDDTPLPIEPLDADEEREACRALKGSMLRQELYALDETARATRPYNIVERNYSIEVLQHRGPNRNAVFYTHPRETLTYELERDDTDPRVTHALTLEVDGFGNVLRSVSIGYGRQQTDPDLSAAENLEQGRLWVTYTAVAVTNEVDSLDAYRRPVVWDSKMFDLTGVTRTPGAPRLTFDEVNATVAAATTIEFEVAPTTGVLQKRRIGQKRIVFRRDDLTGALPSGQQGVLGLQLETYDLAFTAGLVADVYGVRATDAIMQGAGYVHLGDTAWWIPSGRSFYSPNAGASAGQELALATAHFFLMRRHQDAFGHSTTLDYDVHDLMLLQVRDPFGSMITAGTRASDGSLTSSGLDYRVLQPALVMDPNRNRTAVAYDALGLVVGTARMGKPEQSLGDRLDGFAADLTDAEIASRIANPLASPESVLGHASTRVMYDLFAYQRTQQPVASYGIQRETHDADVLNGAPLRMQHALTFSDAFGRVLQMKRQAEPGPLVLGGPDVSPRWITTGWRIYNNKGTPVRTYEPFFTATPLPELGLAVGVASTLVYDPVERVIATLSPDHTYAKAIFNPWRQISWDQNDTVLLDPAADPDVADWFKRLPDSDVHPTWYVRRAGGALGPEAQSAAAKAKEHAGTPLTSYLDALGRPFLVIAYNRYVGVAGVLVEEHVRTRTYFDVSRNTLEVVDGNARSIVRYRYDAAGRRIHEQSMEAGERTLLPDVGGAAVRMWDSRGHAFQTDFDELRRPTKIWITGAIETQPSRQILAERFEYGEGQPNDVVLNLRTRLYRHFDTAGVVTQADVDPVTHQLQAFDFKGNPLRLKRELAQEYAGALDWSGPVPLEPISYSVATRFDALDRPIEQASADGTLVRRGYNEAGLLERVDANLRGSANVTALVSDIDHDARGQRTSITYGNGVTTTTTYDPETFRVARILTTTSDTRQDLNYTFDAVGNITTIRDDAQQTIYFRGRRVDPSTDYTYDALYRLIAATGRELLGLVGNQPQPPTPSSPTDAPRVGALHPNDGAAVGRYFEQYAYDVVGNITELRHVGTDPASPAWTRTYHYREPSQIDPAQTNNRLTSTETGSEGERFYTYDNQGNMLSMPHLSLMRWDARDRLGASSGQFVNSGTPETTYYVYDGDGVRVRKVTERYAAPGATPTRASERIYIGDLEIYRAYDAGGKKVDLERQTLQVLDDRRRIVLIETRTVGTDHSPVQLTRYQLGNHIGSVCLELDDNASIITYEEYTPYGTTSYQGVRDQHETPKRYRFSGQERDEETGLNHHGARYYATWLGRWTSPDPVGVRGGLVLYEYCRGNPVDSTDNDGTVPTKDEVREIADEVLKDIRRRAGAIIPPGHDVDHLIAVDQLYKQYGRHLEANEWRQLFKATPELYAPTSFGLNRSRQATPYEVYGGSKNPNIGGLTDLEVARVKQLAKEAGEAFDHNFQQLIASRGNPAAVIGNEEGVISSLGSRRVTTTPGTGSNWRIVGTGLKGFIVVALVLTLFSAGSAAAAEKPIRLQGKPGSDSPPSVTEKLQAQVEAGQQLANVVQHSPGVSGTLLAGVTVAVQVEGLVKSHLYELAQIEAAERNLTPIKNAPFFLNEATGELFRVDLDVRHSARPGQILPAGKFSPPSGPADYFSAPGQAIYRPYDETTGKPSPDFIYVKYK
ncbi:MAG: VCBS repeat-containing protein [Deltaproteobacteria bacterium]|nr:VCBS repeat-containing protein [Deltaproteobacteria bacterium]